MNITCPCCHASYSLEAVIADEDAREFNALLAQAGPIARPLVAYLGLFRSGKRALSWGRALRLTKEVLELAPERAQQAAPLHQALIETVEAMRQKRDAGDVRPLKNHNYLKRVLESVAPPPGPLLNKEGVPGRAGVVAPRGRRAQAIEALGQWAEGDWLRAAIAHGLAALIAAGRQGAPAADTVLLTAGLWETLLRKKNVTIESVDAGRIQAGFNALLSEFDGWPEVKDLLGRMPARPQRSKLAAPVPEDDIKRGKAFFSEMAAKV